MSTFQPTKSRPIYLDLADYLEEQVKLGKHKPDEKLGTTEELAAKWNVSVPTVQRSLSRLVHKGLLRRKPRLGTFVNSVPSTQRIAMIFGKNPFDGESGFYRLFFQSLQEHAVREKVQLYSFFDLEVNDFYTLKTISPTFFSLLIAFCICISPCFFSRNNFL